MRDIRYIRDAAGNEIALYSGTELDQWNVWGSGNEGKIDSTDNKFFYMKDHLGSVRAVLDTSNIVVSGNDYDMWGYQMEGRHYATEETNYKFTGKERDNESKYDYFGARYYDSRIGRWGGVEPLIDKYPSFTPYNYGLNNPVILIDVNGLDVIVAFSGWGGFSTEGMIGGEISPDSYASSETDATLNLLYEMQNFVSENNLMQDVNIKGYISSISGIEIENAYNFIVENMDDPSEKVILYGYSNGGSDAIKLAGMLEENGINVELLVTVDAFDAVSENAEFVVPSNVKENYNYFQAKPSKKTGARGSLNKKTEGSKTKIRNKFKKNTTHKDIDELVNKDVIRLLKNEIQ